MATNDQTPAHTQIADHRYVEHYPAHYPRTCSVEHCERTARAGGMCQPHYSRAWYRRNRERVLSTVVAWQSVNSDKVKQYKRSYADNHPDEIANYRSAHRIEATQRATRWNKQHQEQARLNAKTYREKHPVEERAKTQRRRARKALIPTERVLDIEVFERDGWICQLCHDYVDRELKWPHPMSKSLDHIIPIVAEGSSHTMSNLQLAHLACNSRKGAA